MEKNTRQYGDESLGYRVLVRDMSPENARNVLVTNINDGIEELMPSERRIALYLRMEEGGLELNLSSL